MTDAEIAVKALREMRATSSPGSARRQAAERGLAALATYAQRAEAAEARVAALIADVARLRTAGTPGVMHPVDQAFYDLVVKERDAARATVSRLEAEMAALREALWLIHSMAGSHTVPVPDLHPASFGAIYRTADQALTRRLGQEEPAAGRERGGTPC